LGDFLLWVVSVRMTAKAQIIWLLLSTKKAVH
jgi:hypothetical protein